MENDHLTPDDTAKPENFAGPVAAAPAGSDAPKPRRRVEATIQIGADCIGDLVRALDQIACDIDRGSRNVVSGGCASGWHYDVSEDESITHESYFAAVHEKLRRQNASVMARPDGGPNT